MDTKKRYYGYVVSKFMDEISGFKVYYNKQLFSFWWINPKLMEWKFEVELTGTLWWEWYWGYKFKNKTGLTDPEFKTLIEVYIQLTLGEFITPTDKKMNMEEILLKCLEDKGETNKIPPIIGVKNFYTLKDSDFRDVEEMVINSQKEFKVKEYYEDLSKFDIRNLMVDIVNVF